MRGLSRVLIVVAGAVALGQLARFAGAPYVLDDAWISASIARNLVEHGVPTYTLGVPAVEGMSNPAWTLGLAGWIALVPGVDPVAAARVVGALGWLVAIAVLGRAAGRLAGPRAAGVGALVSAASGSAAFHAASGLETGGWALLGALGIDALVAARDGSPAAARRLGWIAAAMIVWRPEGALLGAALVVALGWIAPHVRAARPAALRFTAVLGAAVAMRWLVYAAWVPNPFHAKPPDLATGLTDLRWFVGYGLGGLGLLAAVAVGRSKIALALLAIATVMVAGTVWSGGDWMPGYRRFTFAYLVVAWAIGVAVASSVPWRRRVGLAALAGCLLGNATAFVGGQDHGAYSPHAMEDLAARCNATPGVERVALVDIGRFGWHFGGRVVDLVGLTDREIAATEGRHLEKFDGELFDRRDADLAFVFVDVAREDLRPLSDGPVHIRTVTEAALRAHLDASASWRLHGFVRYDPRTWIAVFHRTRVVLPPTIWGPAWEA